MSDFFTINDNATPLTGEALHNYCPSDGTVLAACVNTNEVDLTYVPAAGDTVEWITKDAESGLEILRHDAAHVLAQALKELWGEKIAIAIGPTIQDGFYYDFLCESPISENDLRRIEKRMRIIVDRNLPITRHVWSRKHALEFFSSIGERFKVDIINSISENENLSVYQQGDFYDLCRGPHAPSTRYTGHHFKLTRIAGAYWRGDSNNVMLQRIYGTAWRSKAELDDYLAIIEEAKTRDHRQMGERAQLFFTNPLAKGSVFWLPNGHFVYRTIEQYIRQKLSHHGYQEIKTPLFFDGELWKKSGHQEKFADSMYYMQQHDNEPPMSLKPMNCPAHIELFKKHPKTYKDLPLRLAEFGSCCRYEPSGALFGLMRLRNFTQDDAHIFCTPSQIQSEAEKFCALLFEVYAHFGFTDIQVKIATKPENALGDDGAWELAERSLQDALTSMNIPYSINPGEGAFYGPKLEFTLRDALKRHWQCGTLQLDYVLPKRLNATYVDANDQRQTPVLLHRAILGSIERFLAILVEHTKGILPLWLAPHQVALLTITKEANEYAQELHGILQQHNIRVHYDVRNKPVGFKVRAAIDLRVPFIFSVGKNEALSKTVSVKKLGESESSSLPFQEAINLLLKGINETIR